MALRWIEARAHPKIKKPKVPKPNHKDYKRLRTKDEIQRFLRAARAEPDPTVFQLYALAILTGLRAGELAGLRWTDVELERRQIHVRRSYGGPTKSGDDRIVPLVDSALALLRKWSLRSSGSCSGHAPARCFSPRHASSRRSSDGC